MMSLCGFYLSFHVVQSNAAVMCLLLAILFYVFVSYLWWVRSAAN